MLRDNYMLHGVKHSLGSLESAAYWKLVSVSGDRDYLFQLGPSEFVSLED
jgi:hypothetical protein